MDLAVYVRVRLERSGVPFTSEDVTRIVGKVEGRTPAPRDPRSFAYVCVRNFVGSKIRAKEAADRMAKADAERQADAARQAEMAAATSARFLRAKALFWSVASVALTMTKATTGEAQVRLVYLSYFEGWDEDALAEAFPGINQDLRHQMRHRGRELVLRCATGDLTWALTELTIAQARDLAKTVQRSVVP